MLMIGLRRNPTLWILGRPYNLGGFESYGCSNSVTYSGSKDPLMRRTVFCSADCVGSLDNFLYTGSSSMAKTFSV